MKLGCLLAGAALLAGAFLLSGGYRLSSEAAVREVCAREGGGTVLLQCRIDEALDLSIIDMGTRYATVYSVRSGPLWKAAAGARILEKRPDQVELLNQFWLDDSVGWLVSLSHDPEVYAYEITFGDQTVTKRAALDQPTAVILYPCTATNMSWEFSAAALSENGEVLYQLDYLMENGTVYVGEYRWWPVDAPS